MKIFKKKTKQTCLNCRFYTPSNCTVGTYYANKGQNKTCFSGELWQSINQ